MSYTSHAKIPCNPITSCSSQGSTSCGLRTSAATAEPGFACGGTTHEAQHSLPSNDHSDTGHGYMGCFQNIGIPQNWMVKIMENPIKMDDLGVPLFLETPIYTLVNVNMAGLESGPGLKMLILLEIGIFHCYVSLPEFFSMGQTTTEVKQSDNSSKTKR